MSARCVQVRNFDFAVNSEEEGPRRFVAIQAIKHEGGRLEDACDIAVCAPEDGFDLRVGVPLALKRVLHRFKGVNRKDITREFFRRWPEAHPNFRAASTCL